MRIDADGRRESFCSRFGGTCTASQRRMLAFVSARKCHICQHSVRIYPLPANFGLRDSSPSVPLLHFASPGAAVMRQTPIRRA
jgi:hypothetical protein